MAGALSLAAGGCFRRTAVGAGTSAASTSEVDVEVVLRAVPSEAVLNPVMGYPTPVWRYEGRLLRGPAEALTTLPQSYLGPTFRIRQGQRVRVHFENRLTERSIVHWHGLDVSEENDGHPRLAVGPGGTRSYDFQVSNRPGTYWYHPHPDGRTAPQVYAGLAGLFIVTDGSDQARGLPAEEFELPLVLQDRLLDDGGQLVYQPNPMLGLIGDRAFVNGRLSPRFEVRDGTYRLRVLNGSNARIYKLAWSDGSAMVVLGSDGGLLSAPQSKPYLMLAPGERAEIWADFGRRPGGDEVALQSLSFEGAGMGGMSGGMMMGSSGRRGLDNGTPLTLCRFAKGGTGVRLKLPTQFDSLAFAAPETVSNTGAPRRFQVSMAMMRWMLNGRLFEMDDVVANEHIKRGVTEDWLFSNAGNMMALPHPIHIHGGQFQLISRVVSPPWKDAAATVALGLIDQGWKDTFLLMPGETFRVRVRFPTHVGLFLYHCHNLEHEDMGMMRNFRVEPA